MASSQTQRSFFSETEVDVFDDEVFSITDVYDISDDALSISDSLNIECFNAAILYTYDGSEPSIPNGGHRLQAGKNVVINGSKNISNFKAISLYDSEVDNDTTLLYLSFSSDSIYGAPYNGIINVRKPTVGASEPVVGETYSGTAGEWTGSPTLTYQWQRSLDGQIWEDIEDATSIDYAVQPRDYGYYLRFSETANGWSTKYTGASPLTEIYYGWAEITTTGTNYVFDWYIYISDDISINWGDESSNNYTTSTDGYITHTYATAGTYTIFISDMKRISEFYVYDHPGLTLDGVFLSSMINGLYLDFNNINMQWEVGENAPIPSGWAEFYVQETEGFIWNIDEYPIPNTLTYFYFDDNPNVVMHVTNSYEQFPSSFIGFSLWYMSNIYWVVSPSNPIPENWTIISLREMPNIKWNINDCNIPNQIETVIIQNTLYEDNMYWVPSEESPIPSECTYFETYGSWMHWDASSYFPNNTFGTIRLYDNENIVWEVGEDAPINIITTDFRVYRCPNIAFSETLAFSNSILRIYIENGLSQIEVDTILEKLYDVFDSRTVSGGTIDLLGELNAPPSGVYAAANPPTTGAEYAYELRFDSAGISSNHWSTVSVGTNVAISGEPVVDEEYTATAGTWGGTPTLTYQWQSSADGLSGWANIDGATSISFTPTEDEIGLYLRIIEIADGVNSAYSSASELPVDDGAFVPTDISGLALWLDANDISTLYQDSAATTPVTANNDPVGYWGDKSGNARHVTQTVDNARRPLYKTAGGPALFFNDHTLVRASGTAHTQPTTLFVVGQAAAGVDFQIFFDGVTSSTRNMLGINQITNYPQITAGANLIGSAAATGAWKLFAAQFNSTSSALRVNGAAAAAGNAGTQSLDGIAIGASWAFGSRLINGYIAEILFYDALLDAGEIAQVETYLNAKWSVF